MYFKFDNEYYLVTKKKQNGLVLNNCPLETCELCKSKTISFETDLGKINDCLLTKFNLKKIKKIELLKLQLDKNLKKIKILCLKKEINETKQIKELRNQKLINYYKNKLKGVDKHEGTI